MPLNGIVERLYFLFFFESHNLGGKVDVLKSKELFFGCLKLYSDTCFDVVVTLSRASSKTPYQEVNFDCFPLKNEQSST